MNEPNERTLYPTTHRDGIYIFEEEKKYLNFSSNDYLNIGSNKTLTKEFLQTLPELCERGEAFFSSSSSRLLSGNSAPYARLETFLAKWYQKEHALLFNSGYQANMGIISAVTEKEDCIFSDKLNHNSIIAGILHTGADFYRYKHLDYVHLEDLLKKNRHKYKKALIVSESIFSMDGDKADLNALITLKEKYNCMLMLDEAHGAGIYGEKVQGLCTEEENFLPQIDIVMTALSKAFGSHGSFCVADKAVIHKLINKAPTFIFSTAEAPIQILWSEFILTKHFDHILKQRHKLRALIQDYHFSSHIIPHLIGKSEACTDMANHLKEQGFFVLPVRPPTVPKNTARLRISLNADMKKQQLDALFKAINDFQKTKQKQQA